MTLFVIFSWAVCFVSGLLAGWKVFEMFQKVNNIAPDIPIEEQNNNNRIQRLTRTPNNLGHEILIKEENKNCRIQQLPRTFFMTDTGGKLHFENCI